MGALSRFVRMEYKQLPLLLKRTCYYGTFDTVYGRHLVGIVPEDTADKYRPAGAEIPAGILVQLERCRKENKEEENGKA